MKRSTTPDQLAKDPASRFLSRFRQQEDGNMMLFSLFMFVFILWSGGIAVDLMRFETTRANLQATLDRATLAAADLDQTQPPAAVVQDYFNKAGMGDFLKDTIVDEGINYRTVSAEAEADMPLVFADLLAVLYQPFNPNYEVQYSSLTVSGGSTAEERVSDVEVSMVLDVHDFNGSIFSGRECRVRHRALSEHWSQSRVFDMSTIS